MKVRSFLLLCGLLVVSALLCAVDQVRANPAGVPVSQPGPFVCTTANFKVEAILGPDGAFPTVPCAHPNNSGKNCVDYGYTVSSPTGQNIDQTVFGISADQDLDGVSPAASFIATPGLGDNVTHFLERSRHEYTVRWQRSNTKSHVVHIFILGPSSPRTTTALMKRGSSPTESCLIAGPGIVGDPFQPLNQTQTVLAAGGKCLINLIFVNGELADIEPLNGCVVEEGNVLINGQPLQNNTSTTGITFGTNTTTCYGPPRPRTPRCVCVAAPCQ